MQLEARGVPAHTRTLSVTLRQSARSPGGGADPTARDFAAYVLGLRKRGFVPVGGDIQGPGIIHHMMLSGRIERGARRIETIRAQMPTIAFEATPATGGESCRDRIDRVEALAGLPLTGGWASRLGAEIGGVGGCSHVLTLGHLLGPTATWALEEEERLHGESPPWRPDERVFRRDIVVDGADQDGDLAMAALLTDLHLRPGPPDAEAATRFARQVELRVGLRLRLRDLRIVEIAIAERRRGPEDLETAPWQSRPDRAEPLVGLELRAGVARDLIGRFRADDPDRPLLDLLLMLAPATLQCVASFIDTYTRTGGAGRAAAETGGHADSCYMWRREGALQRRRGT
jgi:hypothetical protein